MKKTLAQLEPTDIVNIAFFAVLGACNALFARGIAWWWAFALLDVAVMAAVAALAARVASRSDGWRLFHHFLMMLCIPLAYKQIYYLGPLLNPHDIDASLIAIDRAVFGINPTQWIHRFAHPALTELLQLAYGTFYFLPLVLAVDLYRRGRMRAFRTVFLVTTFGYYLSYLGYVAFPAIGPRFTLHAFEQTDAELPGLFATEALREYTNAGESIPSGTPSPERVVQRDAFPSGHTQMTLMVIVLAFYYRAGSRWYLGVVGTLLIVATVYLRYHYVVDLAAGALLAAATVFLSAPLQRWLRALPARLGASPS